MPLVLTDRGGVGTRASFQDSRGWFGTGVPVTSSDGDGAPREVSRSLFKESETSGLRRMIGGKMHLRRSSRNLAAGSLPEGHWQQSVLYAAGTELGGTVSPFFWVEENALSVILPDD